MPSPSLDELRTPANGQIFTLAVPLSNRGVHLAFNAASKRKSGNTFAKVIREEREIEGARFWSSFLCFPLTNPPSFLPNTHLREKTFGFLLLLEIKLHDDWFLGVFRHGTDSISEWLNNRVSPLPRGKLTNAFSSGSMVKKMSLQRMTVSKHELRAATYEADDLQTSLPMMAATRCAIRSIRFEGDVSGSVAVTISTSRVQKSGGRCSVENLAALVKFVAEGIQANRQHDFLNTFAQAIEISELPIDVVPTSVLFDWSTLLENDIFELERKEANSGQPGKKVDKALLQRVLGDTQDVTPAATGWRFGGSAASPRGTFDRTSKKFSIKSILKSRLVVRDTQTDAVTSLARWARENDLYNITFSQPQFFYGGGALYRRADFSREVEMVRQCLIPVVELSAAKSEKGVPSNGTPRFPANSIFDVVETSIYSGNDWLCCMDLGDEWADYLCVREHALIFIHCKGGRLNSGASCFHDVIGQGLKNLGRTRSTPAEFQSKLESSALNEFWKSTRIRRLRNSGGSWATFQQAVVNLLTRADSAREVHLVVTMLSLAKFDASAASATLKPPFIQLVWLLASFINSCREMGARPVIYCND